MSEAPAEKRTAQLYISCTPQERKEWLKAFAAYEFSREMRRLIKAEVNRLKEEQKNATAAT